MSGTILTIIILKAEFILEVAYDDKQEGNSFEIQF
jgi:hypothetical protein